MYTLSAPSSSRLLCRLHTPLAMPYKLVSVTNSQPTYPSAILQGHTSSLSWLRPWAAWERILFGLLLPLAVLLLIVTALLTPPPPPNTYLAGLPLLCSVAMPVLSPVSPSISTVLRNDIFHFCCMLCCFVWFWFALYCLVLLVHVVWTFVSFLFFLSLNCYCIGYCIGYFF